MEKVKPLSYLLALFPNDREVCLNALKTLKRRRTLLTVYERRRSTLVALAHDGTANLKKLPLETRRSIVLNHPCYGKTYAEALKWATALEKGISKKRVKISFSQKWAGKEFGRRIRKLISNVIKASRARRLCRGLLVRVFFYTDSAKEEFARGSYRNAEVGGMYSNEHRRGATAVITLKLGKKVSDEDVIDLFAHELAHHISYRKTVRTGEKTAEKIKKTILRRLANIHKHSQATLQQQLSVKPSLP